LSHKTSITTINPATAEPISTYDSITKEQVQNSVAKAKAAFGSWKNTLEKRKSCLYNLTDYLRKNKIKLAEAATKEMGDRKSVV